MLTNENSTKPTTDFETLSRELRVFVEERDWGQFHTAKNLAISVSLEAAELLEHFQWGEDVSQGLDTKHEIQDEVADVFLYLILISERLGFNLLEAAGEKLEKNKVKYPAEKFRGSSTKYNKLTGKN